MAVGNLAPNPESAVTIKGREESLSCWSSWFGKAAEADGFPSLCLYRTISFIRWKVFLMLLNHWLYTWQLASSRGICTPYAGFANLGSDHFPFIEWPSLMLLSAQNIPVVLIAQRLLLPATCVLKVPTVFCGLKSYSTSHIWPLLNLFVLPFCLSF